MTKFDDVMEEAAGFQAGQEEEASLYWGNQPDYWEKEDAATFWDSFEEAFQGIYWSEQAFAEEMAEMCGIVPDGVAGNYFDYEALSHDLFMGDYWSERVSDGVAVFRAI
jgi:antirestriction protein